MSARIPSLDGLRAISIGLVLLGHLRGTAGFPALGLERLFGDYGNLGVVVFFVVSGFLITNLLIEEHRRSGTVSLGGFYARRALRILPPALLFCAALAVASQLGWIHLSTADWLTSLTYTVNYHADRSWYIGHLWSLSVEEQFYLLWPLAVAVLGPKRAMGVAAAFVVIGPLSRLAQRVLLVGSPWVDLEIFPSVADALAIGCLLAGYRDRLQQSPIYRWFSKGSVVLGVVLATLLLNRWRQHTIVGVLGFSVICLGIALAIDWAVRHSSTPVGRLLNSKPMVFIGVLSYSLYLWQQPFLNRQTPSLVTSFPVNLLLVVAGAGISYLLVERPLLRLRSKLRDRALPPAEIPVRPTS